MTPVRKTIILAVAAFAVLALGAGVASAHTKKFDSRVTMRWEDDAANVGGTFAGRVSSDKAGCIPERQVTVYEVDPDGVDEMWGLSSTDASGRWDLTLFGWPTEFDGTYYARVSRKALTPASGVHNHICRVDRSPDLLVDDQAN